MLLWTNAGRSARQWGRSIAWEISPIRRYGRQWLAVGIPLIVLGFLDVDLRILFLIGVLFLIFSSALVAGKLKGSEIIEKRRQAKDAVSGGWAEFRFYYRLVRGLFFGVLTKSIVVLPDRKIPDSNANIDFLVVTQWGVFNVDMKLWRSKFEMIQGSLFYGRNDRKGKFGQRVSVESTTWETKQVQSKLNRKFGSSAIPIQSVWAVKQNTRLAIYTQRYADNEKGPFGLAMDSTTVDGVQILDHSKAASYIRKHPKHLPKSKVNEVATFLATAFPAK